MGRRSQRSSRPTRYLDLLSLRRGDLILTGDTDRESRLIAKQTGGPFSHVAIVRSFAQRFEALGDGVGLTNHKVDRLERRGDRLCALMAIDEAHCLVLRHRRAAEEDEAAHQAFARAVFRYIGVRYSSLDRLLLALPESHVAAPLAGPIVRRLTSVRRKILHHRLRPPGLFCSEVVAEIYAEMGWELPGVETTTEISPNDLYRMGMSPGPISPLSDVVVEPDEACCLSPEEANADGRAADLLDALNDLPPGRFKVDELIKEKDHWYVKRVAARHLADIVKAAIGKYADIRRQKRPERVARLERVLEELERFEAQAREHDAAAGLDRKVGVQGGPSAARPRVR
jgi:hypothetical protein